MVRKTDPISWTSGISFFFMVKLGLLPQLFTHGLAISASLTAQIRQAMALSTLATSNVTEAYKACQQWQQMLEDEIIVGKLDSMAGLCQGLYASCLVRIGRDDQAIDVYDAAIQAIMAGEGYGANQQNMMDDLTLGKARSLQRLLRYSQARDTFLQSESEQGVCGAAISALRLGDSKDALRILGDSSNRIHGEAQSMWSVLSYLHCNELKEKERWLQLLSVTSTESPLYRWIYYALEKPDATNSCSVGKEDTTALDLIKIKPHYFWYS